MPEASPASPAPAPAEKLLHPLAGATLGTEDRGDICIRSANDDLLYRFVPTAKNQEQLLDEVLRVAILNAQGFARRDNRPVLETGLQQAQALLKELNDKVAVLEAATTSRVMFTDLDTIRTLAKKTAQLLSAFALPAEK